MTDAHEPEASTDVTAAPETRPGDSAPSETVRGPIPIVAIAASAGGLEAASELFAALPSKGRVAYVLVQHLDPTHDSLLPDILGKRTALRVIAATDGVEIAAGHVYVIPPNTTLTVVDDSIRLTPRPPHGRHMPADALFKSLTRARGELAISVVLSGGDSDGSLGTQFIKHGGGITFAQDPTTARFPSMPRNAIDTGCVDFVLRPEHIAHEVARLIANPYFQARTAMRPPEPDADDETPTEESGLKRIFRRLLAAHGIDFTRYKRSTLQRRLTRRMVLQKIDSVLRYAELIESDAVEAATLYKDFLIRVTEFFRDPESFEALRRDVFPELSANRSPKDPIRIWVPGCSTGEEAYSLAITLVEYLGERLVPGSVQLFGTDVSETAIEHARAGVYLDSAVQDVSEARVQRFFVEDKERYRIAKSIRDLCIFARQDVTKDPPFARLDLISCRNLLIYLDSRAQMRVMDVFHYALKPGAVLMLGPSETIGQAADRFELRDKQHRLYTRKPGTRPAVLDLGAQPEAKERTSGAAPVAMLKETSAEREADRILLARYAPASLLIDEALNITQFRGETGPYLEHASGAPSFHLQRVVRTELLADVSSAIQEARETKAESQREGLSVDDRQQVEISVVPLQRLSTQPSYLVLFEDGSRPMSGRRTQVPSPPLDESEKDRLLAQARHEVAALRDYLQATMEDHEAVQEELKSAHEEVLSANEEFQSTNEELETSQEELQSSNEELSTTNDELIARNRELADLNSALERAKADISAERAYADAIVESVSVPLLVLRADLTIVRANAAFYTDFRVGPEDTLGKFLYDVGNGQWSHPELRRRLDGVLAKDEPMSEVEVEHHFPRIGYREFNLTARRIPATAERPGLILLALEDITERQATSNRMRESARRKDSFLAMLAHELRNPLTPIVNAVRLLRRVNTDASSAKLHDIIGRQTTQLVNLVDELLDVARIGRGLIEIKHEDIDFVGLVTHVAEAVRMRIEGRKQALTTELPQGPLWVNGDSTRLQQVVSNLLDNATKYTEPGGRIGVSLRQEGANVVLSVRDSGIGIDPAMIEEIFELFSQADTSLAHSSGGLGIGLTVVRRVLEMHGGTIQARSGGAGQGSEFVVQLPLVLAAAEGLATDRELNIPPPASRPRRVLIVDDNVDSAETLAALVRGWGHEVAIANDGSVGLQLLATFQPESALIDIGLPGMTGYEVARRIRGDRFRHDVHLVAITGYGRDEDRDAARAAGFDAHMTKPVALDRLRRVLDPGFGTDGA